MGAVGAIHAIFYTGGTFVFESGWSSIKNIYNAINDNMCAGTFCTLSIINLLIKQTKDNLYKIFGPLRVIRLGGMSIPVEIKEKLLKELPDTNIVDMYGATECSVGVMSSWRENKNKLDAVGKPQKGVKLKIVDENDITITLPANAIGRIAMSSNATMLGYWRNEGAATENLVDGYFVSNDIGYLDEEGFLYLLGRTDDVINVGGKKLFPLEIEAFANKTFDEIDECCCIAVDDPLGICGQIPVLYIKKKEGMPFFEQSIQDRFMQSFEKYKVPHRILCIDKIPKTDGGKYRRSELKNLWNESHGNKSAGEKR
jgi:acyl-CoA synthetase (AMP-forming)/AMP-acid ligase II